ANPTSNVVRTHDQREFAAYAEGERQLGRLRLVAGARIDHLDVDGGSLATVLSPRLGVVLPTARAGVWRASAGRGFRAPSLAERFVSTFVQGIPVVPNPDLDPETAWSFDLGNAATLSSAVRTDAALFWTEAYDLIEPTVDSGRIQFKNVTHARLAGLDLAVTATPPVAGLTPTLSYTFLHARALPHHSVAERPRAPVRTCAATITCTYEIRTMLAGALMLPLLLTGFQASPLTGPWELPRIFGAGPVPATRAVPIDSTVYLRITLETHVGDWISGRLYRRYRGEPDRSKVEAGPLRGEGRFIIGVEIEKPAWARARTAAWLVGDTLRFGTSLVPDADSLELRRVSPDAPYPVTLLEVVTPP